MQFSKIDKLFCKHLSLIKKKCIYHGALLNISSEQARPRAESPPINKRPFTARDVDGRAAERSMVEGSEVKNDSVHRVAKTRDLIRPCSKSEWTIQYCGNEVP